MNWRLFRGNPALTGYTDTELPRKPKLVWSYRSDVQTVSSPIVEEGTTYWCDRRGRIRGVDIKGKPVFEYDLKTAVEATPMLYDSILYIGRIDGCMSAVSLSKRDTIWHFKTMGQLSASPNLMKFRGRKAIVFGSYDHSLYCVDAKTGGKLYDFEAGHCLNGAAAFWKGHVIFGGYDSWLRIIDCKTGIQTDSLLLDAYIPASPAIMGDYCYVGDSSGNIHKVMLENGKIVRYKKIVAAEGDGDAFLSVPAISAEAYYFLSGERNIVSKSRINGKENWKYRLKGTIGESSPVVAQDKVLICTKSGIVSILDAEKGKLLWEYDMGEQIIGSPAVVKDHFMILTAKGTLFCFGRE